MSPPAAKSRPSPGALLRAWGDRLGRRKKLAVGVGVGAGLLLAAAGWFAFFGSERNPPPPTVESMLLLLDAGYDAQAFLQARALRAQRSLPVETAGAPAFVLGAAAIRLAELQDDAPRRQRYEAAARYLEESRRLGFPAGRQGQACQLLGACYHATGRYEEAVEALRAAVDAPDASADAPSTWWLLATSYPLLPDPDDAEALAAVERFLKFPNLPAARRRTARLLRAELQISRGEVDAAESEIAPLLADDAASDALLIAAEIQIHRGRQLARQQNLPTPSTSVRQHFSHALELLERVQQEDEFRTGLTRRAIYLAGRCNEELLDLDTARQSYLRLQKLGEGTPEAVASAWRLARLAMRDGASAKAGAAYARLAALAGAVQPYSNRYLPREALDRELEAATSKLREAGQYQAAIEIWERGGRLYSAAEKWRQIGRLQRAWADQTWAQAEAAPPDQRARLQAEARLRFDDAGEALAHYSRAAFDAPHYPQVLWEAAQCFLGAEEFGRAEAALLAFMRQHPSRQYLPDAWYGLARCASARADWEAADRSLDEILDNYPASPVVYEARLLKARNAVEQGELETAEKPLLANVDGGQLSPASPTWRESLFALGRLLHLQDRHAEAVQRLEEAVRRYPADPQALMSHYLLTESYLRCAQEARNAETALSADPDNPPPGPHVVEMRRLALQHCEQALTMLAELRHAERPDEVRQTVERNCRFLHPTLMSQLGRTGEAAAAYGAVIQRYHDRPEVLDACLQLAGMYRRLGREDDARRALERAKSLLAGMPADARYGASSQASAASWQGWLAWLEENE